jgi:hypothetical protein
MSDKVKQRHVKIPLPEDALEPVFSFVLYADKTGQLNLGMRWHKRQIPLAMIKQASAAAILELTPQDFTDASIEAQALADELLEKQ